MNKISKNIIGAAGEHYVLSQLLQRGWIAALAPAGAPNMDILVTDENSDKLCAIQVKTRRGTGKNKGWAMGSKHETIKSDNLFYVFVDIGSQPSDKPDCYILPSRVVTDCLWRTHKAWLDTPGRNGRPHKDNSMRELRGDYYPSVKPITDEAKTLIEKYRAGWLEPYRDNWSILGLPEA